MVQEHLRRRARREQQLPGEREAGAARQRVEIGPAIDASGPRAISGAMKAGVPCSRFCAEQRHLLPGLILTIPKSTTFR
jgi:hypothetical protein